MDTLTMLELRALRDLFRAIAACTTADPATRLRAQLRAEQVGADYDRRLG